MRVRGIAPPWVLAGASLVGSFVAISCGDPFTSPPTQAGSGGGGSTTTSGGNGPGGRGGGGEAPSCEPMSTETCYDGPADTEGVGVCQSGLRTCLEDGSGFGPCTDQILPSIELCGDELDQSCDGDRCPGLAWMRTYGNIYGHRAKGVAVDASNGIYVTGAFRGVVNYGKGNLDGGTGLDIFALKLDGGGNTLWAKTFGAEPGSSAGNDVTLLTDGKAAFAGQCEDDFGFGGPVLADYGEGDVCYAVLDILGNYVRANLYGDPAAQGADSIAALPGGEVALGGRYQGSLPLSGSIILPQAGDSGFVTRIGPNFTVWGLSIPIESAESPVLVAANAAGEVFVATSFTKDITINAGSFANKGGTDLLIAKVDATGSLVWVKTFGDAQDQKAAAIRVNSKGEVIVGGSYSGSLDFGSVTLTSVDKQDGFVAALDDAGSVLWARNMGGTEDQWVSSIAVDPTDALAIGGHFTGNLQTDDQTIASVGTQDGFVTKLGPKGAYRFTYPFHGPGEDRVSALAFDATGGIIAIGTFEQTVNYGAGNFASAGDVDMFVARLGF